MPLDKTPPLAVVQVASVEFDLPITGVLHLPELEGFSLIGRVYGDLRKRFADGRLIRTSTVVEFHVDQGYQIARTSSGSRYVLVSATGSDVSGLLEKQFGFSACN
jgi:hypothetical protein